MWNGAMVGASSVNSYHSTRNAVPSISGADAKCLHYQVQDQAQLMTRLIHHGCAAATKRKNTPYAFPGCPIISGLRSVGQSEATVITSVQ